MSRTYNAFIFKDYSFDKAAKTLKLIYSFDDELNFTEKYTFDFDFVNYNQEAIDRAFQNLFYMAGVSYYKAYKSNSIKIESGKLDTVSATFFARVYQKGLGEYFYVNKLDPKTEIPFTPNSESLSSTDADNSEGLLIGIGGGKDSLVSVDLLRGRADVSTWSLGHKDQLEPLIKQIGLTHHWVTRQIDPLLLDLNNQDALNGHIPISAIFACVGTVVAILSGKRDVVVSNESSSNEATLVYDGVQINHQYSKSLDFENKYQELLVHNFGESQRYYSLLRQFSEVKIAEIFSNIGFNKYKDHFSSCNRAFVQSSSKMSWCGECPKCAFTYLAFCPFVNQDDLNKLLGKNLLLDSKLEITYQNLLGISGDKPLDCVGEIKESRFAMQLAQAKYPELKHFKFDVPEGYQYDKLAVHSIPEDIFKLLSLSI